MFVVEVNMVTNFASWVLDTGCGAHICNVLQVLQRSRKLSKDEGDGKAIAAEAVGIINLVIWHARLGHISQDRMKGMVDSKSLEIDNLDNLLACESCLKGKMTRKPFVGQSKLANGLLDLINTDICGPLNTQTRGGFSYFITFTDDHSRYGYVYLMRYKSGAFVRFKEFRLEVETQTGRKIKTLRSDRGGECLSGEFIDYLKENSIISQWTPQLNGVAERRNLTLLDMIRSMMSFTKLPLSFWAYALETEARLLNIAPSKTMAQTPYQICHGKPASYKYVRVWSSPAYVKRLVGDKLDSRSSLCKFIGYLKETAGYYFYDPSEQKVFVSRNVVFLERGFPTDTQRNELLLQESSEAPQSNVGTSSAPTVSTDNVLILCRSVRVPQPPQRYDFLGVIGQLDNDPKAYGEAMSNIDLVKWFEAMKSEMDSMSLNQIWTLVDRPKGVRPVGVNRSIGVRLELMESFVEEEIYMDPPEGFTVVGEKQKNDFDPCVYKKVGGSSIVFLVLYVDDILLIGNDIKILGDTKAWLSTQFSMKDLGEASYILGIKIFRDRSKRILGMTQNSYVEKVLKRFKMEHSKRGFLPMRHGVKLSKKQSPKTDEELKRMLDIPYASAVGSIQYDAQCTRPDIAYALSVTSRYQVCAKEAHWTAVKTILKYLRRTKDVFLVYSSGELILESFSDASFQSDDDDAKS
ncbi:UNVERIFIED_CONTAM: Retrovirus-related Pol polyprotein from transposon TNT 1-94 [Sesamum calycinum]|uniref:Retrovirus-related Pol polyprotein from transposon TNT 1-94 n=2 Tax=Sesamum TaxID=4181 RepID=A0AAW2Q3C5_9LAMI